ncbi:MAG TPA: asparagine synthase (glutamine-hydrolyzing) [Gammaproteobacteria bacterium]
MCGIAGLVGGAGLYTTEVLRMADALAHRGPDDGDCLVAPGVGFGHRRLAIIDVARARQPMVSDDGRYWITFNGEIYNYRELSPRLAAQRPLRTTSDTEVLLRLFAERGLAALQSLRGMFAFGIFDFATRRLTLARDHLGQKPLFYWHDGQRFAFASEVKALLALEPSLAELDPDALHEYLTLRFVSPPRSMFKRIRKLPPGHFLVFEDGRVEIGAYWRLVFEPKRRVSFETAVQELDEQAQDAVRHHLVSDVPVGAFLSGGMDSSLVVALMHRVAGGAYETFTGSVPYAGRSELPYAEAVARRFEMPNRSVNVRPSLARMLPRLVWHLDEPGDPLSLCLYYIAELARKHVKVVLGGDGGDELFGGYDRYYGNVYASYYALLPAVVRERVLGPLVSRLSGGRWYRSAGHRLKWLQYLAGFEGGTRYAKSLQYFYVSDRYREALYTPAFREQVSAFDPERAIVELFESANAREALDRMLFADCCVRLPDHPVMILDRMTMAHGLEARSPFLDHRLAEFCASLPPEHKVRGRKLRRIEKALARKYLPAEVLEREKQGFSSPLPYLLADEFRLLHKALLRRSALVEDGYLRRDGLDALLAEHLSGRMDHGQRLWLLCAAEMWYRIFLRGEHASVMEHELLRNVA